MSSLLLFRKVTICRRLNYFGTNQTLDVIVNDDSCPMTRKFSGLNDEAVFVICSDYVLARTVMPMIYTVLKFHKDSNGRSLVLPDKFIVNHRTFNTFESS